MWLNVFIFLVYKIFTEAFLSTLEQWCWKYFGARVKFYLGPICSSELIWVGGTMLVAADSHLGLNDASLALLDCSWPHKPAPFVQRRAQQPILVIDSHKLYSTEQSHNNITFYMLDFSPSATWTDPVWTAKNQSHHKFLHRISIVVARNLPWFSFTALKTSCGKLVFKVWYFSFTWNIQRWCQLSEKGADIGKS